jgi:aminopeptidase N
MQVVEQTLGYEHLLRYLSQMREEYEVPRSRAAPPLLRAKDAFMNYRKGPFALFALRNYIGKDKVNDALRRVLHAYSPNPPLPTTLDLYRELQAATPDSLRYLLHDLFQANTFWELKTEQATAQQTTAGTWQVSLEVQAQKVVVDSVGVETRVPMDDWVEVGVFAPAKTGEESQRPLYLRKHRLRSGKQTITVMVPHKPTHAGIDPNHLMIDLEMEDNDQKVKIEN